MTYKKYHKELVKRNITEEIEIIGLVTQVVYWYTKDDNNIRIQLSLVNAPEKGEPGLREATEFVKKICNNKVLR